MLQPPLRITFFNEPAGSNRGSSIDVRRNLNLETSLEEYSTSPVQDGASPVRDGARPVRDGARPVRDGPSPVRDNPRPMWDGASPIRDGASPIRDGASPIRSMQDGAWQVKDSASPVRDGAQSMQDGAWQVGNHASRVGDSFRNDYGKEENLMGFRNGYPVGHTGGREYNKLFFFLPSRRFLQSSLWRVIFLIFNFFYLQKFGTPGMPGMEAYLNTVYMQTDLIP